MLDNPHGNEDNLSGSDDMESKKAVSVEENIANGRKAMDKVIAEQADVHHAMYRKNVGEIDLCGGRREQEKSLSAVTACRILSRSATQKTDAA